MPTLEMLNNRMTRINARLASEQAKQTPNANKVARITTRKARVQAKIDALAI